MVRRSVMSRKVRALAASAVLVLLLLAMAGCEAAGGTPLKYRLKAGQSYTYDLAMTVKGSAQGPDISALDGLIPKDGSIKARMTMSVKEVRDGISTIEYSYQDIETASQGGTETTPADPMPNITLKIDQRGQVVSVESGGRSLPMGLGGGLDLSSFANQTGLVFPDAGSAKPGDEWAASTTYPVPGMGQEVSATTKAKLLSVSEEGGRTLAKVEFSVDAPLDVSLDLAAMIREMGLAGTLPTDVDLSTLAFKMTIKGAESMKGTAQIDTATGLPTLFDSDILLKMAIDILEAPEDLVPADQRGPFNIDLAVNVKLTQVGK